MRQGYSDIEADIYSATLAAIRPQLVDAIAEAADRVLALAKARRRAHERRRRKDDAPWPLDPLLARLWLVHMRLRIARLLVWVVKTLRLADGAI